MMEFFKTADVVVIGGGIVGTAILRELSKYDLKCVLVEKEPDLAAGTTKANSAILHAGFDAPTGSLKAVTNVRGNKLYHELQKELGLDIEWTGSLVAATSEEEMQTLQELLERGQKNGVEGLRILNREEVLAKEKNLTTVVGALWAPSAGVCWPFAMAVAFAQCAVQNGAEVVTDCRVTGFIKEAGRITAVETSKGLIKAACVINAGGVYADGIARLAGDESFTIHPRRGEYILFDKTAAASLVKGVVFPTPNKKSKGILICTTTHGNTFIGPNAQDMENKEDTAVTLTGMDEIMNSARKLIPNLPMGASITEFAGLRAVSEMIVEAVLAYCPAAVKADFKAVLPQNPLFHRLSHEEQAKLIEKNRLYGRVICRCETVTEAEIIAAIKAPCGAKTVDGVKRRTRAGMGRCQGGFCGPRVTQILARELGIPVPEVLKERADSHLFYEKNSADEGEA